MNSSSTVLVAGASGFIASHVIPKLLDAGYNVVGIDRLPLKLLEPSENFEFQQKDIEELESLDGIDYVINLAFFTSIPQTIEDPVGTTYNNVGLGVKLLELAKQAGVKKFLYPSTASLYGNQPLPWKEDAPAFPGEPYSLQKYTIERYMRYYAEKGLPTVIFRLFQVFGENQRQDQVLAKFFRCLKEGAAIPITQTEDKDESKSAKRDFVYVGDIADAFTTALASDAVGNGEIINLASGYNYTIREIAEIISDNIEIIPKRSFDLDEHLADVHRAEELLGWKATTDVKEWLAEYIPTL